MTKRRTKRQRAIVKRRMFLCVCSLILIAVLALFAFSVNAILKSDKKDNVSSVPNKQETSSSMVSSKEIKETTATVISTGDIMAHSTQLTGAKTADGYDFSAFFKATEPYFKSADLAIGNLEVTFGGTESGEYRGYPSFNTPDSLADAIKASGLNLLLTSNNHSYDTGLYGLKRTAQVLKQKGIEFTGTKETESDPTFLIKEVNNIKIGIADFTYETTGQHADRKYLNGAIISSEANNLINSFSYNRINEFYTNANSIISEMKKGGAEFIVFYIHWGDEYKLTTNSSQRNIAQKLSDLGVNIIVGSHPHVIEPVELISSSNGNHKTVCLYSTGNYVSNQRRELMDSCPTGHTEDGMLFKFILKKNNDGVSLSDIDIIPTWVDKYRGGNGYLYTPYPIENPNEVASEYNLDNATANKAVKSYERTKAIIAEGLTECQQYVGCEITFK